MLTRQKLEKVAKESRRVVEALPEGADVMLIVFEDDGSLAIITGPDTDRRAILEKALRNEIEQAPSYQGVVSMATTESN